MFFKIFTLDKAINFIAKAEYIVQRNDKRLIWKAEQKLKESLHDWEINGKKVFLSNVLEDVDKKYQPEQYSEAGDVFVINPEVLSSNENVSSKQMQSFIELKIQEERERIYNVFKNRENNYFGRFSAEYR